MLTDVAVNTHIEILQQSNLHYSEGYVRAVRGQGTVDQWLFHVTEIRRIEVQRNAEDHLRVHVKMMGGSEWFNTPLLDKSCTEGAVLVAMALLALRDHELGIEEVTYSERTFDIVRVD